MGSRTMPSWVRRKLRLKREAAGLLEQLAVSRKSADRRELAAALLRDGGTYSDGVIEAVIEHFTNERMM